MGQMNGAPLGKPRNGESGDGRGQAQRHAGDDIGRGLGRLAALPQGQRVEAERGKGGEAAEQPGFYGLEWRWWRPWLDLWRMFIWYFGFTY